MCPTSARCGSLAFGVSLCGTGMLGAAAATGGGTGCAGCPGWLGFVLMGLLSSGRGFHIWHLFFRLCSLQRIDQFWLVILKRLSQINQELPASLLLYCQIK